MLFFSAKLLLKTHFKSCKVINYITPKLSSPPQSTCVCTINLRAKATSPGPLAQIPAFHSQQDSVHLPGLGKDNIWFWQQLMRQHPWPCRTPKGYYTDHDGMWGDWGQLKNCRQNKTQKARCTERKEGRLGADRQWRSESRRKGPGCWIPVLEDDLALSIAGCSPPAQGGRLRLISFCQSQFS